jgi:tetratricopeptide (TPR) repeat protein
MEQSVADNPEHLKPAIEHAASLADHWFKAENRENALHYALEAAKEAGRVHARPEAINRYWQALDLIQELPSTPERHRVRVETIRSLMDLPAWARDGSGKAKMVGHIDQALALATERGELTTVAHLEYLKGMNWDNEGLLITAMAHAEASGDAIVRRVTTYGYAAYLGKCARYATALSYLSRARDTGAPKEQLFWLHVNGRCFSARAGKLMESIDHAAGHRSIAEELGDARMQAWSAMEAEPYLYMGLWDKVTEIAEKWLPLAWEIREWPVILWSSAWLAIAQLKLKRPERAGQILDRVFSEVPTRVLDGLNAYAMVYAHIAAAQLHLHTGECQEALNAAQRAITSSKQTRAPLEEGVAHRVVGEAYAAMVTARAEADAAFCKSFTLLDQIQSPPELAQTLLAYGRSRRSDNAREDRALIQRALKLFEEIGATGWAAEARASLDLPEIACSNAQPHNAP